MKTSPRDMTRPMHPHFKQRSQEGLLILAGAFAIFLLLALFTYHAPSLDPDVFVKPGANAGGRVGAWFAGVLMDSFGYLAFLFPPVLVFWAWLSFRDRYEPDAVHHYLLRVTGFSLVIGAGCGLAALHGSISSLPFTAGGVLGVTVSRGLISLFSVVSASVLLLGLFLTGLTLCTGISWFNLTTVVGSGLLSLMGTFSERFADLRERWEEKRLARAEENEDDSDEDDEEEEDDEQEALLKPKRDLKKIGQRKLTRIETDIQREEPNKLVVKNRTPIQLNLSSDTNSSLPLLSLLDPPEPPTSQSFSHEELEHLSREVELRLQDFGIDVQVVAVHPGPVVTRFEMQLAAGVKVSRITALAKDLARSLSAISVRIVEVIPGKSVVGLELPNKNREVVRLSEVIASQQYEQARSPLSLALGKDIAGHPVVVDLAKMPHLLVAGTTGSGKSVGLNAMLLSFLYKSTPAQVRLIMIDPKMLELSIYEGIPHLLAPVVTDMKEAANALRWCVVEMDRRYRLMASLGVRNLAGYNTRVQDAFMQGKPLLDPFWKEEQGGEPELLQSLPYIVVVVDEFADMFMVVGKKVEELIARIAQKARAAGIHLILATQRPSVDVITGLIKANIPTRIAFQVSSKIDSRTILDQQGAEQLLGYGDMLYLPPGSGVPVRVHGAYVADHEVHAVVNDLRKRGEPEYLLGITDYSSDDALDGVSGGDEPEDAEQDALYDQAVQIVVESRRASISNIQRRLKIGYNRAARLMEAMEMAGIVSPMESNGNREILVPAGE